MVKVKVGETSIRVSKAAYETIYKPIGYELVEEKKKVEKPAVKNETKKSK